MKDFFKKWDKRKPSFPLLIGRYPLLWPLSAGKLEASGVFDLCHCDVTQSYPFLSLGFHVLHCVNSILMTDAQISFEKRKDVCEKYKYKYISIGKWGFLQLRLGLSSLYPQCLPSSVWCISHNPIQYYLYNIQKVGKSKQKKKASLILIQTFNACLLLNNPFIFFNSLNSMSCWWVPTLPTQDANRKATLLPGKKGGQNW